MLCVGVVGYGAMARFLASSLGTEARLTHVIARPGREDVARAALGDGVQVVHSVTDVATTVAVFADCAGHSGLREHGEAILRAGMPLITASLGALADDDVLHSLTEAAIAGQTRLHLASGAIGALDALSSARIGTLSSVCYTGRKPPSGWRGSIAENILNLDALNEAVTHFNGTARQAALQYPKNANVAAAVALAGIGFDATQVALIADPNAMGNIHEIQAKGDFGEFTFSLCGNSLPDNARTSALAAMSVVKKVLRQNAVVDF